MLHTPLNKVILIGASTGGPGHLRKILAALDDTVDAAIVIAQHMDAIYLPSFAKQMNDLCPLEVELVEHDTALEGGKIYICAGSSRLEMQGQNVILKAGSSAAGPYNPNIDTLFESSAAVARRCAVMGIILTGIGDDGAKGCWHLAQAGGSCVAESETSAVVYGMPKRAYELNETIAVQHLDEIISTIKTFGAR